MEATVSRFVGLLDLLGADASHREEEDPDDYQFPLHLKKPTPSSSPRPDTINGTA